MEIRTYRPGDERAQAAIYNAAAGDLPGFKPASAEEVARRSPADEGDRAPRFYAQEGGRVVGYIASNPNGRISYPWCLPGRDEAREPLLEALLGALHERGFPAAWTTYRRDWAPVLYFFARRGFAPSREVINYVAPVDQLPRGDSAFGVRVAPAGRDEFRAALELCRELFALRDPDALARYYGANPHFPPSAPFALKDARDCRLRGLGLTIADPRYAHPTRVDAAMPCFRLGAFGTETERHKRINGLVALAFANPADGEYLLAECVRRLAADGLTHAAAQVASDQPGLVALYDRHFRRQGSFPILTRSLAPALGS